MKCPQCKKPVKENTEGDTKYGQLEKSYKSLQLVTNYAAAKQLPPGVRAEVMNRLADIVSLFPAKRKSPIPSHFRYDISKRKRMICLTGDIFTAQRLAKKFNAKITTLEEQ